MNRRKFLASAVAAALAPKAVIGMDGGRQYIETRLPIARGFLIEPGRTSVMLNSGISFTRATYIGRTLSAEQMIELPK